jgi:hypothetical protein
MVVSTPLDMCNLEQSLRFYPLIICAKRARLRRSSFALIPLVQEHYEWSMYKYLGDSGDGAFIGGDEQRLKSNP